MRYAEQNPSEFHRRLDIIAADDMRVHRYLMQAFLSSAGHQIRMASDGRTAYRMVVQSPPDLLVTDLEMPEGNGLDLIVTIRSSCDERIRHMPIIVCSSRSEIYSLNNALDCGANYFVTKPLHRSELYMAINIILSSGSFCG